MDVCGLYIGDTSMTYGSIRSVLYRDYEKFPYGTFENNRNPTVKDYYIKAQEKCQQLKDQKKSKQPCPFCRENKKRPLVNYMRKREVQKHKDSICEEEEIEEEDEEEIEEHFEDEHQHPNGHEHHHVHVAHDQKKNAKNNDTSVTVNSECKQK